VSHVNARTNLFARRLIVERVAAGWPPAHVAEQLGISRATVYKWLRRYAEGGDAALADRSSRPQRMPQKTSDRVEQKVLAARRRRRRGAVVLAAELKLNPSTVGRILARHHVPHLCAIDPITGQALRSSRRSPNRYEHRTPGSMVHVDVKKLGRIPKGAGGACTAATPRSQLLTGTRKPRSATTTCTPRSTTVPGWPTAKYCPTRKTSRVQNSCTERWCGSPATVCRFGGCSPTTPWSTDAAPTGAGCARPGDYDAGSSNPAAPGPTAKQNAPTAPCSPNGPTPAPGPQTAPVHEHLTDSFAATTLNEATPPSAENHPSAGSPPDNNVSGHDTPRLRTR
jgi:transposase